MNPAPPPPTNKPRTTDAASSYGDKRQQPRAPLGIRSALQEIGPDDTPISHLSYTLDISPFGARVASALSPVLGEHLQHIVHLPDQAEPVRVPSKVVWIVAEGHGGSLIGLRYDTPTMIFQKRVEQIVDRRYSDVRRLSFLLALSSQSGTQSHEIRSLSARLGLSESATVTELREWTKQAANLFRHSRGTGSRSTTRRRTREL